MSKLYAFTLSWNGLDKLENLHESAISAFDKTGLDWQWLIKDNGSKDGTPDVVNKWHDNVVCHAYKNNNQNFSAGNNYLFNLAQPDDDDYILLLNNDVVVNKDKSIKKMVSLFEKEENVGVVGAKLKFTGTDKLQHAGVVFSERTRKLPFHFRSGEKDDSRSSKNREFQVVTGAVLLTKAKYYKNIFDKNKSGINGMDENFVWAFDDIDLCLSVKYAQNKRVLYCGETDISHEESVTLKKSPTNKLFMPHNMRRIFSKWGDHYTCDAEDYVNSSNYKVLK